jgi:LysM repeat protein
MTRTPVSPARRLPLLLAAAATLIAFLWVCGAIAPARAQDETPTSTPEGYLYTVQSGDSWTSVSEETGVPVRVLLAANPQAMRVNRWLRTGEELLIPAAPTPGATEETGAEATGTATGAVTGTVTVEPTATPEPVREHIVRAGESWNSIAARYDIPARLLRAANPQSVRPSLILYRGERLIIPRDAHAGSHRRADRGGYGGGH